MKTANQSKDKLRCHNTYARCITPWEATLTTSTSDLKRNSGKELHKFVADLKQKHCQCPPIPISVVVVGKQQEVSGHQKTFKKHLSKHTPSVTAVSWFFCRYPRQFPGPFDLSGHAPCLCHYTCTKENILKWKYKPWETRRFEKKNAHNDSFAASTPMMNQAMTSRTNKTKQALIDNFGNMSACLNLSNWRVPGMNGNIYLEASM